MISQVIIQTMKADSQNSKRGGKRPGAGRKSQGKATFNLSLTVANVEAAKARTANLSATVDGLLSQWLLRSA